jgi:outer membrane lipoprotein-sorting protein
MESGKSGGTMKWKLFAVILCLVLLMIFLILVLDAQTKPRLEEILKKNIDAVGGKEKLQGVKNFSFKAGSSRYFILPDGTMKVLTGMMDPVVIMATLITRDSVEQNAFHNIQMIQGSEKARLQCLARLAGGLFSLAPFAGGLSYQGMRQFGPERHHLISTRTHGLDITFSVDTETFLLKRMTLKTYSPEEGHFEFSYEFGPPTEVMGFKVPSVIFSAPVGAQTSVNPESQAISEVRFNSATDERFFTEIDINMGEVLAAPGWLKGNVLDIVVPNPSRLSFAVVTNWQSRDVEKAGLRTGDTLVLDLDGIESELILWIPEAENDVINYSVPDARIMAMDPLRGDLYYFYFDLTDAEEAARLKSRLTALLPIQVRKKGLAQSPSADEIIGKYLDELGGVEKLRAWKGMIGTGKFVFPAQGGTEVPVTFWYKPPNKQRMEMIIQGQKAIYATDGVVPWYCDPTRGAPVPTPLPEEQAREMNKNDDEYPFLDYKEKGHKAELLGIEEFEGRPVYRVYLVRKNGSQSTHFFDAETGREVRYIMTLERDRTEILQEAIERDFRRVSWLLMPFEIEIKIDGRTVRKMVMETIEVDPDLDDSIFEMRQKKKPS